MNLVPSPAHVRSPRSAARGSGARAAAFPDDHGVADAGARDRRQHLDLHAARGDGAAPVAVSRGRSADARLADAAGQRPPLGGPGQLLGLARAIAVVLPDGRLLRQRAQSGGSEAPEPGSRSRCVPGLLRVARRHAGFGAHVRRRRAFGEPPGGDRRLILEAGAGRRPAGPGQLAAARRDGLRGRRHHGPWPDVSRPGAHLDAGGGRRAGAEPACACQSA